MRKMVPVSVILLTLLTACASHKMPTKPAPENKQTVATRLWSAQALAGPGQKHLNLQPTAAGTNVYVADYKGSVMARSLESNAPLWKTHLNAPLSVGPVVEGDLLIVGSENGELFALDIHQGKLQWKSTLPTTVLAKPSIDKEAVYVTTIDSHVTAFNRKTGTQRWTSTHMQPALILRGGSQGVEEGNTLFVGTYDGKLLAFSKETGALLWDKNIALPKGRTEVERMVDIVADLKQQDHRIVVATYQGKIAAVNADNSSLEWQRDFSVYQNFSVGSDAVYLTDQEGVISALDSRTGATLWQQTGLKGRLPTGPQTIGSWVVAGDGAGYLYWFQASNGQLVSIEDVGEAMNTQPIVSNNILIVYGKKGHWAAFKPLR
jgi:outer membrane protein assembly factor BamB